MAGQANVVQVARSGQRVEELEEIIASLGCQGCRNEG